MKLCKFVNASRCHYSRTYESTHSVIIDCLRRHLMISPKCKIKCYVVAQMSMLDLDHTLGHSSYARSIEWDALLLRPGLVSGD